MEKQATVATVVAAAALRPLVLRLSSALILEFEALNLFEKERELMTTTTTTTPTSDTATAPMKQEVRVDETRVKAAILGALLADAATRRGGTATEELWSNNDNESSGLSSWGREFLFSLQHIAKHKAVNAGAMSVALMKWMEETNEPAPTDQLLQEFFQCMKAGDRSVELCGAHDDRGKKLL